jgi:UDP-galactopyranose mutase
MYDYLIVGSGLFGSIFAYEAKKLNKKCLVIEKRSHIGGNIFTAEVEGIRVHQYGPHIFHTSRREEWDYISQFAEFNRFTNAPVARYGSELYNLPFNMNTFNKMWGVITPEEAKARIRQQIEAAGITDPKNLEEQAISLVGRDIYEKLIMGIPKSSGGAGPPSFPALL